MKNRSVIYKDSQCEIFLAKNMQVGIRTKFKDISHHFLRDMVEDKAIGVHYIWREDNPAYIMKNNTSETDFARHIKIITEG